MISLAAPGIPWIELPRAPDLRVYTKSDDAAAARDPARTAADLVVSARTGDGLRAMRESVRERLVPRHDRESRRPWVFDPRLAALTGP